ncbi:MAG: hypothetical protein K1Y02_25280 [Candidatus Hydrogenedentes bacterium]|nr:hypothetical protein [Candidatus Hydrogenedentota bacterium]
MANALYRGSVVLLSSHLERYVESLIVEAVDAINSVNPAVSSLPEALRMAQIEQSLRVAFETKNVATRIGALKSIVQDMSWFWEDTGTCNRLRGGPLIDGFDNPLPRRINRLFESIGVGGVVGRAVGLDGSTDRGIIEVKVEELVQKRNAIAHTGMTTDLTQEDVMFYMRCSRKLVRGIDIIVGGQLQGITLGWPWTLSRSHSSVGV